MTKGQPKDVPKGEGRVVKRTAKTNAATKDKDLIGTIKKALNTENKLPGDPGK